MGCIAVIGAGVAGLLSALNLRCEADVFEAARPGLRGRRCTGVVSLETLGRLPRAERFTLQRYSAVEVAVPELDLRLSLASRKPFAAKLDRGSHEEELAGLVEDRGHRLLPRTPVLEVRQGPGGVDLLLPTGWRRYSAVVLAEGYPPTLAKRLGLSPRVEARVGVQALARVKRGLDPEALYVAYSPRILGGFAWLVPLREGRVLVGVASPRAGPSAPAGAARLLSRLFELEVEVESKTFGGYVLRGYPRRLARGRVAALGDAVATVKSLSGGGLYAISALAKPVAELAEAAALGREPSRKSLREIERVLKRLHRGYLLAEALDRLIASSPRLKLKLEAEVGSLNYDDHAAALLQILTGLRGASPLSKV